MIQINTSTLEQQKMFASLATMQPVSVPQSNLAGADTTSGSSSSTIVSISKAAQQLYAVSDDRAAPKVTKFAPTVNGKDVSLSASITLTFSEALLLGSGNITLKKASGEIVESFDVATSARIRVSGKKLKIDPTLNLENGTRYIVTVDAGSVTDRSGNSYSGIGGYSFTTKPEKIKPRISGLSPLDGAQNISTTQPIQIKFSEAIKRGKGDIRIIDGGGKVVQTFKSGGSGISISGDTLTISHNKLANDTKYKVEITSNAIQDLADNYFKGTKSYDFRTATTDTPPTGGGSSDGGSSGGGSGAFSIDIDYSGDAQYLTYFQQAKAFWENVITADLPDINGIDDLRISATIQAIDGVNGVLGSAGPTLLRGGTLLPYQGTMQFDSADMSNMLGNGTLLGVIKHEMGHVLGLGSLWGMFGFNTGTDGQGAPLYQYTGARALAAYRTITGNGAAAYVPLENNGSGGTANAHWEEDVFTSELMTGFANGTLKMSTVTIGALEDLGYNVNYAAAETGGLNLMVPGGIINAVV